MKWQEAGNNLIYIMNILANDSKESIIDFNNSIFETMNEYLNDLPINDIDILRKSKFQDP